MQQTTNTPKNKGKLATEETIAQVAKYIDEAVSVHIIWDVPGIASGETTIERPVTDHDMGMHRLEIADSSDIETAFALCYDQPDLAISESEQAGGHSVCLLGTSLECWLICES